MNLALTSFIQMNNIDEEVLYNALHQDILETILSEVCEYMKTNDSTYISMKKIYYRSVNDIEATKLVVQNICHLSLPEQDLDWLNKCIKAFMKKKEHRKPIPNSLKEELWNKQGQKCSICSNKISVKEGHVDHIVPWDYVGDELDNNYQILCSACNHRKSNHVALTVRSLILNRI